MGLRLGLRSELRLEADGLLRCLAKLPELRVGLTDLLGYLSCRLCDWCKLLSLGDRLRKVTGLKSLRRRLMAGETERE